MMRGGPNGVPGQCASSPLSYGESLTRSGGSASVWALCMKACRAGRGPGAGSQLLACKEVIAMSGMLRIPRSRGALSGVLLVLLGAWSGLIAFVGPYFHYAYTPNSAWSYTSVPLWLEILPPARAVVAGVLPLARARRPGGSPGGAGRRRGPRPGPLRGPLATVPPRGNRTGIAGIRNSAIGR